MQQATKDLTAANMEYIAKSKSETEAAHAVCSVEVWKQIEKIFKKQLTQAQTAHAE